MKKLFVIAVVVLFFAPTLIAQVTISGNLTATAGANNINSCTANGVVYVGGTIGQACWGSSDLGTQINNAYAAATTSNSTRIHVVQGTYSFNSPIVFGTVNKPALIECDPNTKMSFAPATGIALTLDWGIAVNNFGHMSLGGITGCWLNGNPSGNATFGVQLGLSTGNAGTTGAIISNNKITDFGNANVYIQTGVSTYLNYITNNWIGWASGSIGDSLCGVSVASGENVSIVQNIIAGNQVGLCIPAAASTGSIELRNNSIDSNVAHAINLIAGGDVYVLTSIDNHYEDNGQDTQDMIVWNGNTSSTPPTFRSLGDTFTNDKTTGTDTETATCNPSTTNEAQMIFDNVAARSKGRTVTNFVTTASGCQVTFIDPHLGSQWSGMSNTGDKFCTLASNPAAAGLTNFFICGQGAGAKFQVDTNGDVLQTGYSRIVESNPPTGITGSSVLAADPNDHFLKYNPNNAGEQHIPQSVSVSSNYTNATTSFTTVTGMSWPIAAGKSYTLDCTFVGQGSATTAGPKFQLTGPSSPTLVNLQVDGGTNATAYANASSNGFSVANTALGTLGAASTNLVWHVNAVIINGSTAGTLALQAAANGTGTLTISGGSCQIQ